jgi:hypothetical protein
VGTEEALEDVVSLLAGNTDAAVSHPDHDVPFSAHHVGVHILPTGRVPDGVVDQLSQDVPQALSIRPDRRLYRARDNRPAAGPRGLVHDLDKQRRQVDDSNVSSSGPRWRLDSSKIASTIR